jgi:hypothetical protein
MSRSLLRSEDGQEPPHLRGAILAVVLLAAVLRLAGAGSRLSVDDAYSWLAAASPNAHVFLQRLADNENSPPLIYLAIMAMPGTQPVWLRVPAILPGIALCVVIFAAFRPRLGTRAALLAALAAAVAPYLVTYSNLARGFMLADLALLVALWAMLSIWDAATVGKWVAFGVSITVAVYTEYTSVIIVCALVASSLILHASHRRTTVVVAALGLLPLAAWIPEMIRGQHQVGMTKFDPQAAVPSLDAVRDLAVTLALGENGGTANPIGRWALFAAMLAAGAMVSVAIRRASRTRLDARARRTVRMVVAVGALTLVGYAAAAVVGVDVFTQRYLTILVPLLAVPVAAALAISEPWLPVAIVIALLAVGADDLARRVGGEWQPDPAPALVIAERLHPRTVLTNTPSVLYYLGAYRPVMDRPYDIGPGRALTCARPCLVVDDPGIPGGSSRRVDGRSALLGSLVVTVER